MWSSGCKFFRTTASDVGNVFGFNAKLTEWGGESRPNFIL